MLFTLLSKKSYFTKDLFNMINITAQNEEGSSSSHPSIRVPPRQGWTELPPPDPEIRVTRSSLMSPSSGEGSSSPIEVLDRADVRSLDELSQVSKGSRRTVNSADGQQSGGLVSQQARQRLREKTKSMVEKQKRIAKRMLRSQQKSEEGGGGGEGNEDENGHGTERQQEEIGQGDRHIEQSIQLGSKYIEGQLRWDDHQQELGSEQQKVPHSRQPQGIFSLLVNAPARRSDPQDAVKYGQMLVWKGASPLRQLGGVRHDLEAGRGGARTADEPSSRKTRPLRMGEGLPTPLTPTFPGRQLLWRSPVPWADWIQQSGSRRWAHQRPKGLWLDLQGLEFDHHWLFTRAEAAQLELVAAFDAWAEVHQQMLRTVKEWLALRQQLGDQQQQEATQEGTTEEEGSVQLDALFTHILELQSELSRCRAALARTWASVDQSRGRFLLERLEGHAEVFEQESEGGVPEQLKAFFHSPLFMLSERQGQPGVEPPLRELEKQRRMAVSSCRYQVQVFFNELLVGSSEEAALQWPDFSLAFGQLFCLRVFERPEQLRLALRERFGRANWQQIADIFVPLPEDWDEEAKQLNRWMAQTGLQFASTVLRGSHKGSLGCGQGGVPFLQGRLFCSLRCQLEEGTGPETAAKMEQRRVKARQVASSSTPSLFPEGTLLCPEEAILADRRLLALENRWKERKGGQQQQTAVGIQLADESSGTELAEQKQFETAQLRQQSAGRGELELEMRRRLGREFAVALRRNLRESGQQQRRARSLAELVREESVPQLSLGLLPALFENRQLDVSRRLKPIRNPVPPIGRSLGDPLVRSRLVLNIQHAIGIPQRANGEPTQLFLLCSVQRQCQATALVDGRHSNWQETLVLEMAGAGLEDCLEVELFDREVLPMEHDDRERDTRHERVENRWLGAARVPLAAVLAMGKLDGHLSLQGPLFYTGYKSPANNERAAAAIRLLISVDPPTLSPSSLAADEGQSESLPSGESDPNMIADCLRFESRLRRRFPARRFVAAALDSSGKRAVASRFLRKLAPPQPVVDLVASQPRRAVQLAAQMVASLPAFHEQPSAGQQPPIWSTVDEILRLGTASPDESGLLLCCWLLGLQLPAVLLLGTALPHGPSAAFVLVQFGDGQHWLIDPGDGGQGPTSAGPAGHSPTPTGQHFVPSDPGCPLLSVGTILSGDNVFGNVQRAEHPSQLDFDLRKKAHWEPLFADGRRTLPSLQPETLRYEAMDENSLMELRTGLEREIRLRFDESRPFSIPQWNLLASRPPPSTMSRPCAKEARPW